MSTGNYRDLDCSQHLYDGAKPCDHWVLRVIGGMPLCGHHYTRFDDMFSTMCCNHGRLSTPYAMLAAIRPEWLEDWELDRDFARHFVDKWWTEVRGEFRPHYRTYDLYRFYDAEGGLLYVGVSLSAVARACGHRQNATWWDQAARMEIEHLSVTRRQIEELEQVVIGTERPAFNILHNGA